MKPTYEGWETQITRTLNLIGLIAGFNVFISALIFPILGIYGFQTIFIVYSFLSPLIIVINRFAGYRAATHIFYMVSAVLMFFLTAKMGIDSYILVFFFPLILSTILLLGRKETFVHLVISLLYFVFCLIGIVYAFAYDLLKIQFTPELFETLRLYVISLGIFSSIIMVVIITHGNLKRENQIKKMLKEKEILLAEVYHRVKNNMNIVTSLLNLRKNMSESEEVKTALESCRQRVYAMSLVHEKFFKQDNLTGIQFDIYAKELVRAISATFDNKNETVCTLQADSVQLSVDQAIPCGLILNEIITNSFKHGQPLTGRQEINIEITLNKKVVRLSVKDNGQGFDPSTKKFSESSMGIELIHSLCDQLDATCEYKADKGSHFVISFKKNK
ncbi:MAG: sensor histidine kinase [Crocinitomicaceae bacterium]|nr:sensor histidine kinase [Crocinitomicaceae bacterium]